MTPPCPLLLGEDPGYVVVRDPGLVLLHLVQAGCNTPGTCITHTHGWEPLCEGSEGGLTAHHLHKRLVGLLPPPVPGEGGPLDQHLSEWSCCLLIGSSYGPSQ